MHTMYVRVIQGLNYVILYHASFYIPTYTMSFIVIPLKISCYNKLYTHHTVKLYI